jgi:hypothetical protein
MLMLFLPYLDMSFAAKLSYLRIVRAYKPDGSGFGRSSMHRIMALNL